MSLNCSRVNIKLFSGDSIHQLYKFYCGGPAADGHLLIKRTGHDLIKAAFRTLSGETLRVNGQISLPNFINAFPWVKYFESFLGRDAHQENGIRVIFTGLCAETFRSLVNDF